MLTISNITLFISNFCIFSGLNFQASRGDRIGLVGPNGAGKTTLLRLIAGRYQPEEGSLTLQSGCKIGFLEQDTLEISLEQSVRDFALQAFAEVKYIEKRLEEIGIDISESTDYESDRYTDLLNEMERLNNRFAILEGDRAESRTEEVLEGLGFKTDELSQPLERFSGGWRMRAVLAKLLLQRPDVLMLDEPTNHLDIDSIEWLEQYLKTYDGAVVIVSHDRYFLNRMVTQIAELRNRKIFTYTGNYDKFEVQREEQVQQQQREFEAQQREIEETERFIERFRYKATKARQVQSRVKALEKVVRIEEPDNPQKRMQFRFPDPPQSGKVVMELTNLIKSYPKPEGDGKITVFTEGQQLHIERGDKIALIGPNGAGKSTLARILYGQEPFEGTRAEGHNVLMTFFAQHLADVLESNRSILEEMESEARTSEVRSRIRSILGSFLFSGDDVFKPISVLSGGERGRVALAKTLLQPANVLILDEPTNHLDISSKEVLIQALEEYKGTILAVSHDRYFLSRFATKIWRVEGGRVAEYDGGYDYYEWKRGKQMEEQKSASSPKTTAATPMPGKAAPVQSASGNGMSEDDLRRSGPKSKEQKRLEAEIRKRYSAETGKLKKEIETLESQMAKLESRKATLDEQLADPGFYQSEEAGKAIKEHADLVQKLDAITEQWAEKSESFESLEAKMKQELLQA
ncbi:MAG: ABC-F family ATP-binding cassette domain-containing protein [Balneolales bacterium]|nr:ABC-F family ATP-binding cassette domain-containing protein [Balneolales bacterium]